MRSANGRISDRLARLVDAGFRAGSGDKFHRGYNIPESQLSASSIVICSIVRSMVVCRRGETEDRSSIENLSEARVRMEPITDDFFNICLYLRIFTGLAHESDAFYHRVLASRKHIKIL